MALQTNHYVILCNMYIAIGLTQVRKETGEGLNQEVQLEITGNSGTRIKAQSHQSGNTPM